MADHTTDTSAETDLIDRDLVERVLGAGLRTGGDFAEVFAEDKRSSSAVLDDGKVEELTSGRDRGAGIRVVVGRDHRLRPHRRPLRGRACWPRPRPRRRPPARVAAAPASWRLTRQTRAPRQRRRDLPGRRRQGHQGRAAHAGRRGRPRAPGGAISQVSAGYGDSRRRILVANTDGLLADDDQVRTLFRVSVRGHRRHRHADRATSRIGHTVGFELFDQLRRRGAGPPGRRAGAHQARRPPGAERQAARRHRPGGGGVLFHEACGHGLEADLVGKGASVFRGRVGEQVAAPLVTLVDDGTMAGEWGAFASTTRATPAQRNVLIEDGVLTDYMWDFLRARKEGRPQSGQRPAPELPAPADGAHDQHLRARRPRRPRRHRRGPPTTASTWPSSAAARSTPPPATSCSA